MQHGTSPLGNVNLQIGSIPETQEQEIKRLQKEIGERQSRLRYLISSEGATMTGLNSFPYVLVILIAGWLYVYSQMIPLY